MTKNYLIELEPGDKQESFEEADNNLLEISVQQPGKDIIESKGYRVYMKLSPDGMIGLGTELIRKALLAKKESVENCGRFVHLFPILKCNSSNQI